MKKKGRPSSDRRKDKMLVLKVNEEDRSAMHDFVSKYNMANNKKESLSAMVLKVFNGFMKRQSKKIAASDTENADS